MEKSIQLPIYSCPEVTLGMDVKVQDTHVRGTLGKYMDATVTKIGRKYITVTTRGGWALLFSKEDGRHCDPVYGSQYILWDSEERIHEFERKSQKLRKISDYFTSAICRYDPRNDIYNSDVIDSVYDVLVAAGIIDDTK